MHDIKAKLIGIGTVWTMAIVAATSGIIEALAVSSVATILILCKETKNEQ